tara:strand:+ start:100 stop:309 length:210 start_codon:yes stop_codon:yes gene_type:complete
MSEPLWEDIFSFKPTKKKKYKRYKKCEHLPKVGGRYIRIPSIKRHFCRDCYEAWKEDEAMFAWLQQEAD